MSGMTPTSVKAMRKMFELLDSYFDVEGGQYKNDYSDGRVAKECDISESAVKDYRLKGYGKIKPPNEVMLIEQQLRELETLYLQTDANMREGLKDLKARLNNLQRKFD